MMTRMAVLALVAGLSAPAIAQEAPEADEAPEVAAPRHKIKVLQDPYDLASFYRSDPRPHFSYSPLPPYALGAQEGGFYSGLRARHGIAGFYRLGGGGRYSAFWQSGYAARPLLAPGRYGPAYRETIGENGDLYLLAPFLAPVGPLAGAFYR
jgi:hypothetical protein